MIANIICGVKYRITITPFNVVGDGRESSTLIPGT